MLQVRFSGKLWFFFVKVGMCLLIKYRKNNISFVPHGLRNRKVSSGELEPNKMIFYSLFLYSRSLAFFSGLSSFFIFAL